VDLKYEGVPFPKNETLVYKEQVRRSVSFAAHNPGTELRLIPQKLYEFYRGDSKVILWIQKGTLDTPAFSSSAEEGWRALADGYYLVALALVVGGIPLWASLHDPRRLLLLAMVVYYSFLFGFVFVGEQRFHSALIPLVGLVERARQAVAVRRAAIPVTGQAKDADSSES
jgi:hypothetical protein